MQQHPRQQIRKHRAHRPSQQPQHAELHREDANDPPRVAPSVFSTTASRVRRNRVLAIEARIISPAKIENPARNRTTNVICRTTLSMRSSTSARLITVTVGNAPNSARSTTATCFGSTAPRHTKPPPHPSAAPTAAETAPPRQDAARPRGRSPPPSAASPRRPPQSPPPTQRPHESAPQSPRPDRNLRAFGTAPPLALANLVPRRQRIRPAKVTLSSIRRGKCSTFSFSSGTPFSETNRPLITGISSSCHRPSAPPAAS
jgi:hypothetical protein